MPQPFNPPPSAVEGRRRAASLYRPKAKYHNELKRHRLSELDSRGSRRRLQPAGSTT